MADLLAEQIETSDAYYRDIVAKSNCKYSECRTDLKIHGVSCGEIMAARKRWMEGSRKSVALERMLRIHPEHYMVPDYEEGSVEVIGEHMARLRIVVTDDVPAWVIEYGDPSYSHKKPTIGKLDDGTVLFYILHEFKDTEEGCNLILRLLFPEAAPRVWFVEHAEHLAIEFRRRARMVAEEK
jgi:hypothetical protein